jgi:hypothetical protein
MLACVSRSRRVASPSRRVVACLCAVGALALSAGVAPEAMSATAPGGGNAFSELTQGGQETPTTTTATTASTEPASSSNSNKVVLLALVAAVALLIAIAFVIVRDARRVAPVDDGALSSGASARDTAAQMRKRRAKAKAARRQRKRNR